MAEVKWIKICTDIFDDEKMSLIDAMPEHDGIIVIWFKLLCMAGKQNNGGVFMLNDKIAYTDEMLATIFRRPINTVRLALNTFEQFGMIEIVNNAYTIPNWEKHQSLDKLEAAKEKNRLRVAKHREKQKMLAECNVTQHYDVTPSNDIEREEDKEEDTEKDKKKENKKESKKTGYDEILSVVEDESLRDLYLEYIKMRKLIKSPMTDRALTMLIKKVNELEPTDIDRQKRLLETAIMNNWKSVYPLKDEPKQKNGNSFDVDDFFNAAVNRSYKGMSPRAALEREAAERMDKKAEPKTDDPELQKKIEALKEKLANG